ncbi:MAG TPA: hypothetical protein VGD17_03050 [Chitinophagaceae bacterium]
MSKDKKDKRDIPAKSDINPKSSDSRHRQQEEFDNRGKDDLQKESEVRNTQRSEQMRDSQEGDERMIPHTKGHATGQKGEGQRGRDQHPE